MRDGVQRPQGELIRVLGIAFGIAAVIGGSVGQGILRQPGIVAGAAQLPLLILALWALGGLIAAINATAIAELGAAIPQVGGPFVYVRRAFGRTAGIITGWSDVFITISSQAFMAVVVAEFIARLGGDALPVSVMAPLLIALFYLVNLTHTRISGSSQTLGSAIKGLCLIALVVILFVAGRSEDAPAAAASSATGSGMLTLGAFAIAMRAIQNTYDGWNNCAYFCEEMTAPEKQLPRSLFGGIATVTLLYLMVNAAMLYVLTPAQMAASNFPAADALGAALGDEASVLLILFGIVSVGAILNLNVMFCPRVILAMSRDGALPANLSRVSQRGSPFIAMTAGSGLAAIFAASGTYEALIAFNVALGFVVNSAVCLAAIRLRRTEPDMRRPWKIPLYPVPVIIAVAINLALLVAMIVEDPFHSLAGIALPVVVGLAYRLFESGRRPAESL